MKKIVLILTCFFSFLAFSQTLFSNLEKKTIALGEVNRLEIRVEHLEGRKVIAAPQNELLPFHFEEIEDSISTNPDVYNRIIEFTVFDEGKYTIPELEFNAGGKILKTIPYEVDVINTAQKSDNINDIMKNKETDLTFTDYVTMFKKYLIIGLVVVLSFIALIIYLIYGRRKKGNKPVVPTNQTLKDLDALKKKKYIEAGNFRSFYVELIDISRNFLTKQYRLPADVLLTDDLVSLMKTNNTISVENEKVVEEVFTRGDMVKFAKTFPDEATMRKDFEEISDFVKRSSKDIEFENLRKNG